MPAKVLRYVAANPHSFPEDRTLERTGVHVCPSCLAPVDAETYFALETLCADCHERESEPSPFRGGHPSGFSPIDDPIVRDEIDQRGYSSGLICPTSTTGGAVGD